MFVGFLKLSFNNKLDFKFNFTTIIKKNYDSRHLPLLANVELTRKKSNNQQIY